MSATIKGLGFSDVEPQPGFTATRDENGGWTGRHTFAIRRTAWANGSVRSKFAKGAAITGLDPNLSVFWEFCKIVSVEVTSEEGDFTMVTAQFSGGQGATYDDGDLTEDAEPTYRLSGQLQDAPLSMHPKWEALTDGDKEFLGWMITGQANLYPGTTNYIVRSFDLPDDTSGPTLPPAQHEVADDAFEFAKRIARGETTYSRPIITWTESTQGTDGLTNAQLNKLGNISTPRGSPPEAAGTRDWMLTSAFQEQRGELFTTDLEWTLSEKGGHDEFLYEQPA